MKTDRAIGGSAAFKARNDLSIGEDFAVLDWYGLFSCLILYIQSGRMPLIFIGFHWSSDLLASSLILDQPKIQIVIFRLTVNFHHPAPSCQMN